MEEKLERRQGRSEDSVDERSDSGTLSEHHQGAEQESQDHQRNQPEFFSRTEKSEQFQHQRHTEYTGKTAV